MHGVPNFYTPNVTAATVIAIRGLWFVSLKVGKIIMTATHSFYDRRETHFETSYQNLMVIRSNDHQYGIWDTNIFLQHSIAGVILIINTRR